MDEMDEFDIMNIFIVIREKKKIIIAILLASILIGIIYSFAIVQPKYESTCKILMEKADESVTGMFESDDIYSDIMTNSNVQNMTVEEFKNNIISIEYETKTKTININVKHANKDDSYKIVNEASNVVMTKLGELYNLKNSKIIEQPKVPEDAFNIDHARDIGISILIGIGLSFLYILFYSFYNNSIKNREDIEHVTDMNVLGVIPLNNGKDEDITPYFIKNLRANIEFNKNNSKPKSLLITSFLQGEGKSYIASKLAKSFADTGIKVLLIDGDMIDGTQHKIFNVECKKGLSDLLKNISNLDKMNIEEYIKHTDTKNLSIITLGNKLTNSSELLMSNKFNDLLKKLKEKYDIVIFDSTPSLNISDSIILSSYVDASLLVAEYNKTKIEDLIKLENSIKNVGGKITGVVINKLPPKHKECKLIDKYSNKVIHNK